MFRPAFHRLSGLLIGAAFLTACSETPSEPATTPAFAILDGARGGNAQFFFLPPMVRAPTYSGTFDATQHPVVQICELTGAVCGTTVATFSGSAVKLNLDAQAYVVNWPVTGLDPARTYRIVVSAGTRVLGYADVVVLVNDRQVITADRNPVISTINGSTLSIRFRIESGATTPGVWHNGDFLTFTQTGWDDPQSASATVLNTGFPVIYYAFGGSGVLVGTPHSGSATFTTVSALRAFLPQSGPASRFLGNPIDPTTSDAGVLGGEAVALTLNVDFADAGFTQGASQTKFGDLILCRLAVRGFNGMTVRQFLAATNRGLIYLFGVFTHADLAVTASQLNASFPNGTASQWAQDHLQNSPCPGAWRTGDLITYSQDDWGSDPKTNPVADFIFRNFDLIYPGGLEVGILGTASGYSLSFSAGEYLLDYLPASGVPGPLNADLLNPTSSTSGILGGLVVALQLNLGVYDAGYLHGSAGVSIGDLRVCDLPRMPLFNNQTVRQLQGVFNQRLGGASAPYDDDELWSLIDDIGHAFEGGVPSNFARAHLLNGPCP